MHLLVRYVRFSVDPFNPEIREGFNPYASRPTSRGLAMFLELGVQVMGPVDPISGFVIDVGDIDQAVRRFAVPLFVDRIQNNYCRHQPIRLQDVVALLWLSREGLKDKLGTAALAALCLKLNPFRCVEIRTEDPDMVYYSEKFEFAAMHKLWNPILSDPQNLALFGKCANPSGHGHNYVLEVTVKISSEHSLDVMDLDRVVDERFIQVLDHKNLNADVPYFVQVNPTMEHITRFAWQGLVGRFGQADLHGVTLWESDRTSCTYSGETAEGPLPFNG
jgi:6-pyruvoyltetrahydropterin/6-carboxytetrahydropterin synthase